MENSKIMVVGAGTMGSGIAQVCLEHGFSVVLTDCSPKAVESGEEKIRHFLKRKVEKGKWTQEEYEGKMKNLQGTVQLKDGWDAGLVIEAATEDPEIKKTIFRQLHEICDPETILASNTSTISITMLGGVTGRAEQVIGMHFFAPAPLMKLVELIAGLRTSRETIEKAEAFARTIGKNTVKAPDTSAFLVNRLLDPMWNEAIYLVMEGNKPEDIDNAMKWGANHPMGPLELCDYAGLDVVLAVMDQMHRELGDKYKPCPLLRQMVHAGLLGKKTGQGFYRYD